MPSYEIYRGPSLLDGSEIVVIAQVKSGNRKTGDMVQTWILRADQDPLAASRSGADAAICGDCPHRGKAHNGATGWAKGRTCYVVLMHAPLNVWKTWKRGRYAVLTGHKAIAEIGAGRMVRIGSYGDGAAVPGYIWDSLTADAKGWTAYTHQGQREGAAADPGRFMTSVESRGDALAAWNRGERTFRVIPAVSDVVKGREILCPASEEAGQRTTCDACGLCAGASIKAKSIAIVAHGNAKTAAKVLVAA